MNKKVLSIAVSIILIVALTACQTQNEEVLSNFYSTYIKAKNLDEFCQNNNSYALKIEIEATRIQLVLRRTERNWEGSLSLYEGSTMIQNVPVTVIGEELVFHTQTENKAPITVLLFSQFDPRKCTVIQSSADVMGAPEMEEVIGEYPIEELSQYMQRFYDLVLSNLTMFDRKEDYMAAITASDLFVFNQSTSNENKDCHSLTLGFSGNQNVKWDPGFGGFENVSMLFSESVPIAW